MNQNKPGRGRHVRCDVIEAGLEKGLREVSCVADVTTLSLGLHPSGEEIVGKSSEIEKYRDGSSVGTIVPPWEISKTNHPLIKERVKAAALGIFNQITTGQYSYGTRLASERELSLEFKLSRAAVRQVIEFLETYEIVKRQPNSGTFVVYTPQKFSSARVPATDDGAQVLDVSAVAETASPFEMNILCSIIEPEMVRLAALYMSVRDLADLRNILGEIEKIVVDAEQFAHLEKKFLMKIAEGTHNKLLCTVYTIITEVRRQPHWCATRTQLLSPERIAESQARLKSLYTALENHDAESAAAFMKLVIAGAQDDLLNNRL